MNKQSKNIEAVYPMSPLQQGILFHSLMEPESGVYFDQFSCTIQKLFQPELFRQVWQQVMDRHGILRTLFLWQRQAQPLQIVCRQVPLPWQELDSRGLESEQQQQRLQQFLQQDQKRGFILEQAPLMRLILIQLDAQCYQFVWSFHHLLLDGWSVATVLKEVLALYEAALQGRILVLPPVRPYQDYIRWLQQQNKVTAEQHWKHYLQGFQTPTRLQLSKPILDESGESSFSDYYLHLSKQQTEQLQTMARTQRLTINTLLQGAWALLLSRYCNQQDVLFGATVSGRPTTLPNVEQMVGMFINTLPVRVQVNPNVELGEWLRQLQHQQSAKEAYVASNLVDIQACSEIPAGQTLFDTLVVFENYPVDQSLRQENKSLQISHVQAHERTNYPLTLQASLSVELFLKLTYDSHLLDEQTIVRLSSHLQNLLLAIADGPVERLIGQLSLLTSGERQQLLYDFNDTATEFPSDLCIHQLFEQQVEKIPDAIALVYEKQQLTYRQLNQRANQLAHYLQSLGVGPDVIVGLCVEPSVEMVVGLLGILKAGGAYLPLDPSYPQEQLAFMLEDAQASLVLSERSVASVLSSSSAQVLLLDELQPVLAALSKQTPICTANPRSLAYVIYTSGSAGIPKGVMVEHQAVNRLVKNNPYIDFSPHQVFLQLAPITFDAATFELWGALLNGARLALTSTNRLSLEETAQQLQRQQVSTLWLTAGLFQVMTEHCLEAFEPVRQLLAGGDILPVSEVQRVLQQWPHLQLVNGYGPTEGTTFSCTYSMPTDWRGETSVPIGRPIANTQMYVLDEQRQPMPIGVMGELYIGGAGVARGYLNQPELTAEKFIANPFNDGRLYKTGDLGRWRTDGNIEFLGRMDHQVKLRGFRIELGEIESVLCEHPVVTQAVVIVKGEQAENKQLIAHIVPTESETTSLEPLREYLKSKLPEYMVPALFIVLEELPLTVNGKVDRKALSALEGLELSTTVQYVAPQTPNQELLAQLWSEVLDREQIGIHDNFFELGGHSLLATQLISRVREVFEVELPLRALFEQPSIASLAQALQQGKQAAPAIVPIARDEQFLSLSFAQQRLWFLAQLEGPSATYNIPLALRLTGSLDVAALEHCLSRIVQRHEVLRTHFAMVDGSAVQIIAPHLAIPFPVIDVQELSESSRQTEVRRLVDQEAQQPFELSTGPLLRVTLLRLSAEEHVLLVTMHHIISDGWSMGVLVKEVTALYQAYITDTPAELAELPIQYADFAHWQRQWLTEEVLQAQVDYWKEQLAGAPPLLELSTDHPRPAIQSFRGNQLGFSVPAALTQQLKELSRQHGVTLFMTLLGAYAILLNRYSGQQDVVIGSPIANRNRAETESLIGFFVNTLALRIDLSENPSFEQLLALVRQVALGAYAHQDLPFEKLVEELQPQRSLSHSPLFQVSLTLNAPIEALELQGLQLESLESDLSIARFDIALVLSETTNGLVGNWEYNSDLFAQETIERLNTHFQVLLEGIVAEPEQQIQDLPLLTAVERQRLLYDFNETATEFPSDLCVHQLFEQQMEKTPDAIALVFEQEQLTYQQLNQKANQLAHYLQSLGVGPEVIVGLCVERSVEMVVGLLGILKAGGTYLPLDSSYPQERLAFMIEDAQVPLLLTQASLADNLPSNWTQLLLIEDLPELLSTLPTHTPICTADPRSLAYVIYTSGSTGIPKGVMVEHSAVVRLVKNNPYIDFSPHQVFLQLAPITFDAATFELWGALLNGARLALTSTNRLSLEETAQQLQRQQVSTLWLTAGLFQVMTEHCLEAFEPVRQLLAGGDILPVSEVQRVLQQWPHLQLVNGYGPTEGTTFSCTYSVPTDWRGETSVPIGRPIANTQMYVLDEQRQPMPIGVMGELYIGGAGVARGYLNQPELTAEKFIANPFNDGRLYKTGDLGYWRADGNIEFLGRMDSQVKLRGFRIELEEIEAALTQHSDVTQAVVLFKGEQADNKQLVAYIVSTESETISLELLREYLKSKLPEYMVPALFVVLEALPLTVNGKIDRKALSASEGLELSTTARYVPPQTPTQELLAQLWSEVLNREQIGIYDNFFELGGHSLLATQLISRVREVFEVELPLRALFEQPTIGGVAQELQRGEQAAPPIVSIARDKNLPLSFAQQRLWFLAQLEGPSATYNMPMALRLIGTLDVAALEHCLTRIVQRHEVLRTHFAMVEGIAVQIITPHLAISLGLMDLQELSASSQQLEVQRLVTHEAQQSFDLSTGPLLRVTLLELDAEEHVLLLNMHHIISDGWSMGVLVKEVTMLYQAYITDTPAQLAELPIQYADFAHWQRQWLQGEVLQSQVDYWKEQLDGAPPLLELPTDHPRPSVQTFRGSQLSFSIPAPLTQKLQELSRQHGVTLFMTLLGAYAVLLSRYSGQQDMVIGSPIANRNRGETENLIGFFVNTLALRIDLSGELTFEQLLERVRQVALGAYGHQDLPFEKLVEELQPQRSLSHSPLFQVMFALQNAPMGALELSDLQLEPLGSEATIAKFDLTLALEETEETAEGVVGSWEYNSDLFDQETIERLSTHFQILLEGIVAEPEQQIQELPVLTSVERQQLLYDFNDTAVDYRAELCVHQLFEQQVEKTPDSIALVFEQEQLTYRQLNRRANQLAHYLQYLGVGPDVIVGLCVERSVEMVVGLLGILKAGGAYLPVDPTYPQERLAFIIEDAQVTMLLTQEKLTAALAEYSAQVVCLDADWGAVSQENLFSRTQPEHLAYVIYTSGSTGIPKGVMVEHHNVARLFAATHSWFSFNQLDVWTLFHSYAFDFSVWELWGALLHGGRLVMVPHWTSRSPDTFYDLLCTEQVTVLNQTPSAFQQLMQVEKEKSVEDIQKLEHLRLVIFGGEALDLRNLQPWFAQHGDCQPALVNMYGITETTVHVTYRPLTTADANQPASTVGRPIPDSQIYVLDQQQQPVPIGVAGELYIGGAGVARGYLNRPELTSEKFIPNPFNDGRLYKTGDLGRWRADGNIEYLGRMDHQVKLRGFRIELGEVESALCEHPAVAQAIVLIRGESADDKQLVAYVVPIEGETISLEVLREYLKSKLPEYMVPALFVVLETLPLTVNGKIDRKALSALEGLELSTTARYVAPQTPTQELLAQLWSEVLDREQIGIHDNFFDLGGHSLLATQLISRVRNVFEVELPLRALFEQPTIAGLAQALQQGEQAAPSIVSVSRDNQLPLSFAQQRLWFLAQLEGPSATYNIPMALRLTGALDVAALQHCLGRIVQRHEVLRTHFAMVDGSAVQIIAPHLEIPFPVIDLQPLSDSLQQLEVQRLVTHEAQRSFDLSTGPLLRIKLVQLASEEHVLLLNMHHIISDGWSMGVLVKEVTTLYQAYITDTPAQLAELPIQYADFAHWQRQWLQGEVLQSQVDYWKEQLAGAPPLLELPTDHPRPSVQTFRGSQLGFRIPAALTQHLKELSREHGVTLFMTLLGAYAILLSRYSGQQAIVVGSPIANRNHGETENLIGFFVNTLALCIGLEDNPSFEQLLARVRQVALGAYGHQDLPFEKLVEELQPQRSLSHSPIFQVMFILQNAPMGALDLQDLQLESWGSETTVAKFDLTLSLEETSNGLAGSWEYNSDLFEQETIERLSTHFQVLLEGIVAQPEQQIQELPVLTAVERQQLLYDFNDTATEFPSELCVHQLFEKQVEKTPDAIALVFEKQQLTYQQLNQEANQLAHYLQSLGVGPDVIIGLCVERSIDMVVGLLGILKAGGAYLPLDPSYPQERLAFMLEDAQASLVLSESSVASVLSSSSARVLLLLDELQPVLAALSKQTPICTANPRSLAYVIYTSGSTGMPKGVMVEHSNAIALLTWAINHFDATHLQAVLASTSICFDLSVFELFAPLSGGGCVLLVSDALALLQKQLSLRPSLLNTVPSAAAALLSTGQLPESVKVINLAGEALSPALVGQLYQLPAVEQVHNLYGPSEDTTYSSWALMAQEADYCPIGAPIANTQMYVLDEQMQPVPIGVVGELYIGGAGVARGYLNQPELTAEKFIPNSFNDGRLYKTGDLGRWRADGNIEYLGRMDHQVKLRGFRIELGEIESVLCEHPTVQQAVVLTRGESADNKQLVAHVVPIEGETMSLEPLREYLKSKLPEYMVPALFVELEALPLTVNGKIDRKALSALEGLELSTTVQYVPPQTPAQELMVQVWSEVLKQKQIGIHDNFFDLGGHSLLATQLISHVRDVFKVELPLRALFEQPTIAGLSAFLEQPASDIDASPLIRIRPQGSLQPLFCIHPLGGAVGHYTLLTPHLHPQQPLYALQAVGLEQNQKAHSQIEEMASAYITALQQVQPEGPYQLAGWSFGGLVAFEMAQQLQAQQQEVGALLLLDTAAPASLHIPEQQEDAVLLADMLEMGVLPIETVQRWGASPIEGPLEQLLEKAMQADLLPPDFDLSQAERFLQVARSNLQAARHYVPTPYQGQITIIQAAKTPPIVRSESLRAWEELATAGVDGCCIQGDHYSILAVPHVQELTNQIQNRLLKI
jgi:amino acid adenylation domain-containing protein